MMISYGAHYAMSCLKRILLRKEILFILKILLILSIFSSSDFAHSSGLVQQKPDTPPVVEKITDKVYRVGKAIVDTEARTVTCPGEINMDEGAIEYLAVAPGGKLHESLLRVDVRASAFAGGFVIAGTGAEERPANAGREQNAGGRSGPRCGCAGATGQATHRKCGRNR